MMASLEFLIFDHLLYQKLFIKMEGAKEIRANKMDQIRRQLQGCRALRKNTIIVQEKQEKNRQRRQSLQMATQDQAIQLRRQFSDEDEEQERSSVSLFHEKYRLLHKIGEGANAVVHACEHKLTGRTYAVKKISSKDEETIIQLKKNFLNMQQLHHPNIIRHKALYLDVPKKVAYLVMELFEFPSLAEINDMPESQLKNVFQQVFEAIQYIHHRNTCHRDIKPENILYDSDSKKAKLIDFGISKRTFLRGVRRDMLTIIGTNLYIAPEIIKVEGYDQKVDLWSAGVSLYQMATGSTPFDSQYKGDVFNNIIKGKVDFSTEKWKGHSILLKDLITWLLKPAEQRLTASEAHRHLWFNPHSKSPVDKQRKSSAQEGLGHTGKFRLSIHKAFHEEQLNQVPFSKAREEGNSPSTSPSLRKRPRLPKQLGLFENENFQLYDDDEDAPNSKGSQAQTSGGSPPKQGPPSPT